MRLSILLAFIAVLGPFEATSAQSASNSNSTFHIVWEVKNRFRLFREEADFARQLAVTRGHSILAAERQLGHDSSGFGWAKDVVARLCLDKFGNLLQTCERDGERESYLAPRDHPIGVALSGPAPHGASCIWTFEDGTGPIRKIAAPCDQEVKLRVLYGRTTVTTVNVLLDNGTVQRMTAEIAVRDVLIAGLGDSIAAGEGNPDRALELEGSFCFKHFLNGGSSQYYRPSRAGYGGDRSCEDKPASASDTLDWARHGARWMSPACHRSLYSYQVRATLALAVEQPHIAVTLLPLACTGAHIGAGMFDGQLIDDCPWVVGIDYCKNTGPAQLLQLSDLVAAVHRTQPQRTLDMVLLSIGANDVNFAALLANVVVGAATERTLLKRGGAIVSPQDSQKSLNDELPAEFSRLRVALKRFLGGNLRRVVFVSYPNPAMQSEDKSCPGGPDGLDVNPAFSADGEQVRSVSDYVNGKFLPKLKALATCDGNQLCHDPTTERMTFVDAHQAAFTRHGMCVHAAEDPVFDRDCFSRTGKSFVADPVAAAENPMTCSHPASDYRPYASRARWIRTVNDSYFTAMTYPEGMPAMLRPSDIHDALWSVLSAVYGGAVHPTAEGYAAMADATLPAIRDVLGLSAPPGVSAKVPAAQ
jgi:hypothetical protein